MAEGPTRNELALRIAERNDTIDRQARELDNMRKEIEARVAMQRVMEETNRQLYSDRERLTATVEILSRRLASDNRTMTASTQPKQATPVNQTPYRG